MSLCSASVFRAVRWPNARKPSYILVESPPAEAKWLAIRDRLGRAAKPM